MRTPADDGNQPGLWPAPDSRMGGKPTPLDRRVTPRPITRSAPARTGARRTAPVDVANLWGIEDIARYLGIPKNSIYGWRKTDYGPPAMKVGKYLRWRPEVVIEWARQQERSAG